MCFDFSFLLFQMSCSLRNTHPLRNKINQICAWASRPSPARSPGIPLVAGISSHTSCLPGRRVLDPKDETQELSGQGVLLSGGPPQGCPLNPGKRGLQASDRGRQRVWTGRSWGEPSEPGLPSWDTVTITHEVRSPDGSSAGKNACTEAQGCPGNDKTPVLQF